MKEENEVNNLNQNGYMIEKPASSFNKHKKFKPY